jgi:hypothetical protein
VVNGLYLTVLSRPATEEEFTIAGAYLQSFGTNNRWGGAVDIAWALMNNPEFLYRH